MKKHTCIKFCTALIITILMLITTNCVCIYAYMPNNFKDIIKKTRFCLLEETIKNKVSEYSGDWSVYVENLKTGDMIIINDSSMPSASILKLFILCTVYDSFNSGKIERTNELSTLMRDMICVSSNTAANRLLYVLGDNSYADGIDCVNEYIKESGFSDKTHLYNPFQDSSITVAPGKINAVSALDCGKLLSKIYHRQIGCRKMCDEIEGWLQGQQNRMKIPSALPEGVESGNKTGETSNIENDSAIVYTSKGDYIICIFSSNWDDKGSAVNHIREVTRIICSFIV